LLCKTFPALEFPLVPFEEANKSFTASISGAALIVTLAVASQPLASVTL